jgi:uncharacterized SAM-binding protein YcdF (DUF218 family)
VAGAEKRRGHSERGGIFGRLLAWLILAAFLFGVYLFHVPLFQLAGHFWVVDEPPGPADAIVILGEDDFQADRAARAAELYRAHWAPRVVASGPFLRPYMAIPELMRRDLMERGVPSEAIVPYANQVENTREEAIALRKLAVGRGWRHVLIVTSNYHTRRAHFIFYRVWPQGFEFRIVAAPDANYDADAWWRFRKSQKLFLHETVGMVVAAWELRRQP